MSRENTAGTGALGLMIVEAEDRKVRDQTPVKFASLLFCKKLNGVNLDERILGDSDFVENVLSQASEQMERRYRLKAKGWTLIKITERVAEIFGIEKDQVVVAG